MVFSAIVRCRRQGTNHSWKPEAKGTPVATGSSLSGTVRSLRGIPLRSWLPSFPHNPNTSRILTHPAEILRNDNNLTFFSVSGCRSFFRYPFIFLDFLVDLWYDDIVFAFLGTVAQCIYVISLFFGCLQQNFVPFHVNRNGFLQEIKCPAPP